MSRLTVVQPASLRDQSLTIEGRRAVIGRSPEADWQLGDPSVSRRHAMIHHDENHDEIEDLHSLAGTFVNGQRVLGRTVLHPGDVVQCAAVQLRYQSNPETGPDIGPVEADRSASFTVDRQQGATINNVGRDQYNQHIQQVINLREDAMSQIASMNLVSRVLTIVGFGLAMVGALGFIGSVVLQMTKATDLSSPERFGESTAPIELIGYPAFAVFLFVALAGFGLSAIGAIIHMAAARQVKHLDRDLPLPSTMPGYERD